MSLDLSRHTSTRGPTSRTAQGVLSAVVLAGLLTACGAAGAEQTPPPFTADTTGVSTTPAEIPAKELESAAPVAADAAEVEPITEVLQVQEEFVPSEQPAGDAGSAGAAGAAGAQEVPELDPSAVAAAEESADGPALQEIVASLAEFEHQGWEQQGRPVVVGKPVVAPLPAPGEGDGESVRVTVCLDASKVTVVDQDGKVVRGPEKNRRALHNYDLFRQPGEAWEVVQHGFPADPTC